MDLTSRLRGDGTVRFLFQICPILAFQFVALASPCSAFDIVGIMVPACRSIEIEAIALDGDAHGKGVDGSCIFIKPGERIDVRDTHDGGFQLVIDPVGGPVWLPAQVLTDNEPLSSERYSEIGNETISEFGADLYPRQDFQSDWFLDGAARSGRLKNATHSASTQLRAKIVPANAIRGSRAAR